MSRRKLFNKTSQIIALCSVANFINAADRVIMPIAIIPMAEKYKWSLSLQGWILSSFAFGYFTSQVTMQICRFSMSNSRMGQKPSTKEFL